MSIKKLFVVLPVAVGVMLFGYRPAASGEMCRLAAEYGYSSPALNTHCIIEWLWETIS